VVSVVAEDVCVYVCIYKRLCARARAQDRLRERERDRETDTLESVNRVECARARAREGRCCYIGVW